MVLSTSLALFLTSVNHLPCTSRDIILPIDREKPHSLHVLMLFAVQSCAPNFSLLLPIFRFFFVSFPSFFFCRSCDCFFLFLSTLASSRLALSLSFAPVDFAAISRSKTTEPKFANFSFRMKETAKNGKGEVKRRSSKAAYFFLLAFFALADCCLLAPPRAEDAALAPLLPAADPALDPAPAPFLAVDDLPPPFLFFGSSFLRFTW
jgi:hypothetical protein